MPLPPYFRRSAPASARVSGRDAELDDDDGSTAAVPASPELLDCTPLPRAEGSSVSSGSSSVSSTAGTSSRGRGEGSSSGSGSGGGSAGLGGREGMPGEGSKRLATMTLLSGRRLWMRRQLRRLKARTADAPRGPPGPAREASASLEAESREECEQRVALIRKYEHLLSSHLSSPSHGGSRAAATAGGTERPSQGDLLAARALRRYAEDASASARGRAYARPWLYDERGWRGLGSDAYGGVRTSAAQAVRARTAPFVNTSQFHREGYMVVEDVLPHELLDAWRHRILKLQPNESTHFKPWWVPSAADPGVTIPNFMGRPSFHFMHDLPSSPPLLRVLRAVFGGARFRYCSHNDIGIDRIVGWHKDVLNDQYKKYQSLPLWQADPPDGGHFIVKALIYLEDHAHDDDALVLVPGSHRTPSMSTEGAITLHPKKGSVIVFEQRATHRGRYWTPSRLLHNEPSRILVSLGFGRDNVFTDQFEKGTRQRQADQCGSPCTRDGRRRNLRKVRRTRS